MNNHRQAKPSAAAGTLLVNGSNKNAPTPIITNGSSLDHGSDSDSDNAMMMKSPPELPLTPQSNNKCPVVPLVGDDVVEVVRARSPPSIKGSNTTINNEQQERSSNTTTTTTTTNKQYSRNMSALSVSTGGSSTSVVDSEAPIHSSFSYDETENMGEEEGLLDTPKSSLVSNKKQIGGEGGGGGSSNDALDGSAKNNNNDSNSNSNNNEGVEAEGGQQQPQPKAVDWIPQQQQNKGDSMISGITSQAVKLGDDFTESSFTTMTTIGGAISPPLLVVDGGASSANRALSPTPIIINGGTTAATGRSSRPVKPTISAARGRTSLTSGLRSVPARSPRPPRHMRAVDWCPPSSTTTSLSGGISNNAANNSSHRPSVSSSGAGMASDKTAVTSRAVRLGDDATVTTFATMTTMGDAGSILEADTEDEASSSSSNEGGNVSEEEAEGAAEEESMEDVKDDDGAAVVDKIPAFNTASRARRTGSQSGTTNHAVRATDDQSVVTFATMTTAGGMGMGMGMGTVSDMVDKVPSFPPAGNATTETMGSFVTDDTVQMGDNASLATWATTNTMGGQMTGNVVDHVPTLETYHEEQGRATSSNLTVGTSNAVVKDDPSETTFTTAAVSADSGINEVVDKIPTFAGGGCGTGRSIISAITAQAVRASDDRSVASFATMTTMGDLGSIFEETEVLPDEDLGGNDILSEITNSNSRPRLFSGNSITEIDRAIVDVIPEAASSVASGTTNRSVRTGGDDSVSVTTFGTVTTAGRGELGRQDAENDDDDEEEDMVDKVPTYPNDRTNRSIISGTTDMAVRLNDDQSVATWATAATASGQGVTGHLNEHVVDKTPSFREAEGEGSSSAGASDTETNRAQKDSEDQSVVTWNTMTTAISRTPARSPPITTQPYAVDRVPSFSNARAAAQSISGTTNYAIRAADDQSVVTFATMTTVGGGMGISDMVDKVPSFAPLIDNNTIVTNDTVQMGDNQSLATWATANTMGGQLTGNVVDHVPGGADDDDTVGTSNAIREEPSVTTFTTSAMSRNGVQGISEVVDRIPTFAGGGGGFVSNAGGGTPGGTPRSVTSGVTNQAVRMGDDRSVTSFATMTTVGGVSTYDNDTTMDSSGRLNRYSNNVNSAFSNNNGNLVDRIPSSADRGAGSIVSGRTDNAVRDRDDLTVTTFATMTTAGDATNNNGNEIRGELRGASGLTSSVNSDQSANDASGYPGSVSSSLSRFMAPPPTTGILRESRHTSRHSAPPSAMRESSREYRTVSDSAMSANGAAAANIELILPIDAGESVSNTHILRAIADLRFHVDYRMGELRELNRRDSERVLQVVQMEQAKRTALEARLYSQLLLQSESMVAMELKLLRLEAKAAQGDSRGGTGNQRSGSSSRSQQLLSTGTPAAITDRLPPIAATPSTPNHSDESEVDSFEELELTPRGTNRQNSGGSGFHNSNNAHHHTVGGAPGMPLYHRPGSGLGMGPTNIAVVTRSGASVASAVTATSFQEGEFSHAMNEDERSDDGDIEDDDDDNDDDGSASTPAHSRNRISNLESILLNPIQGGVNVNNPAADPQHGISTRAVRGERDTDGNSSLPTSVTSTTMASTVVTATTRGGESSVVGITRIPSRASETGTTEEASQNQHLRTNSDEFEMLGETNNLRREPRSRSQSPLTVQSAATGTLESVASASLGPSILSTAAVASSRTFGTRRANAAAAIAERDVDQHPFAGGSLRSSNMANRVVSFTTLANAEQHDDEDDDVDDDDAHEVGGVAHRQLSEPSHAVHHHHVDQGEHDGGGDSITMPDELDNFSDVADAFSNSARVWREEYEARLDAIHKRLGN